MSNNRVYAGSRYQPQGRNANLSGAMFKRTPIFTHVPSEKQIDSSPFSNYKTNQSFSSEATMEQRVNPDTLRILIKQQLGKLPSPQDNNRKLIHTLQAQITDLKERMGEYEKQNNTKLHEASLLLKEQMKQQAQNLDKQVQQQITSKLRSFFQKVNYELKKDILKIVQDQFLTISYGEDLQNRLDDINGRIQATNHLINSKHIPNDQLEHKIQQATFNQSIEPKLTKIQKDIQSNRKQYADITFKIKGLEEWVDEEKKKIGEKDLQDKLQILKQKVKNVEIDLQKKINNFELQFSNSECDISIVKDRISQLQKYNEEQRSLFLDFNKKLSVSSNRGSIQSQTNQLSTSILVNSSTLDKHRKSEGDKENDIKIDVKGPKKEELKKTMYQFDTQNYLMDGEGNYILTQQGKPIKLSEQQIQALFESNVIDVVQ